MLIVDTKYPGTGPTPKLNFQGVTGTFCGIVWIVGKVKITGNATILGAVFVDEDPPSDTTVSGTPDVIFNQACVDGAINSFGGTGTPGISFWKEYSI